MKALTCVQGLTKLSVGSPLFHTTAKHQVVLCSYKGVQNTVLFLLFKCAIDQNQRHIYQWTYVILRAMISACNSYALRMPDIVFNENFNTMNIFVFIYMTWEDLSFYIISNFLDFCLMIRSHLLIIYFLLLSETDSSQ